MQSMLIWMAIVGAVLGWVLGSFEEVGLLGGGLLGGLVGWGLRRGVRREIVAATAPLHRELGELRAILTARSGFVGAAGTRSAPVADLREPADEPRPAGRDVTDPLGLDVPLSDALTAAPTQAAPVADAPWRSPPGGPRDASAVAAEPAKPGLLATGIAAARGWLFGGNTIVRLGLVILFVGLSFLASYAAAAGLFPIELRLAMVGLFGIALLGIGFRTRVKRPDFAVSLQGGGVAVVYLTLFGAARFYDLVPLSAAFVLMIAVCALGCALALLQRSQALAVTAFAGGFAVPLLLGGDTGNALGLFGYGTILNLAILVIARAQTWRVLNLVGFFATFGIAGLWGATAYGPDQFLLAQIFLIVSVLIYVATAMLYTRATPGRLGNAVDTTLLFGPALTGFGLEVALVGDRPFGSAFAALGFAALYLGVAAFSRRRQHEGLRVMNEAMLAIGIGFVTMAIPLALGARWTTAAWALEGAGAFWIGMRQARWVPRLFGLALQVVATLLYLVNLDDNVAALPFANAAFVGAILVAFGWIATAWFAREPLPEGENRLARIYARGEAMVAKPAFLTGFLLWWIGWLLEATRRYPAAERALSPTPVFEASVQILLAVLAYCLSAALFETVARRRNWPIAAWPARVSVVALWLGFLAETGRGDFVLYAPGCVIWLVAIGVHGWLLLRSDQDIGGPGTRTASVASHVAGVWLGVALVANMLWLGIDRAGLWSTAWSEVVLLAGAVAVLGLLALWAGPALHAGRDRSRWPLDRHARQYAWTAAVPIALGIFSGTIALALFSSGDTAPLPFVPLLNPVDLMVALAVGVLLLWRRAILAAKDVPAGVVLLSGRGARVATAALGFVAANGAWLRTAHHLAGVPWRADVLLGNALVETGIAILWTAIALTVMVIAHRRAWRSLWLAGAGLLGATVVKLLVVDLYATGGGARIIAFIAVGMLMLLVGYLAPLPPKAKTEPHRADPSRAGDAA
ncbi:DUF2339 domain-containing protein [Sphingomonas sp. R86520]|uniref:DUF2339 domain-containing protein n=1 Tax=Sphingomonas sp. R86520 TaxID=3093859 RepID=UPI0036D301CC